MKRTLVLFITAISIAAAFGGPPMNPLENDDRQTDKMIVGKKYLIVPIRIGADKCNLEFEVAGKKVIRCGAELAQDVDSADFWAYFSIEAYKGQLAIVSVDDATAECFAQIRQSNEIPGQDMLYSEPLRPQLRFSQMAGWNNDVNGLVYYEGEWHMYYQHCPTALRHADKFWGHAVSKDLIHWKELPVALSPFIQAKGQCFSGSTVVDHHNTAGFQTGAKPPLVAVFSDFGAGVGEALAYSNDLGRTFTYYDKNPVLKHRGNDPRVIWYKYDKDDQPISEAAKELGGHWVMVTYDKKPEYGANIAFFTSIDLKNWILQGHLPGYRECPDILELPVDPSEPADPSDKLETRWVVYGADAQYAVGQFDGKMFTPEHEGKHRVHYGAYFAAQTFSNPPDDRTIQIGWAKINMPGMAFNQTFTMPHSLSLRKTPDGIRMYAAPVKEIAKLRKKTHSAKPMDLTGDSGASLDVSGELFEIRAEFDLGQARSVGLDIGGNRIIYDVYAGTLHGAPMTPVDGKVSMQVIVDRPMIEICGNAGEVYFTGSRGKKGDVSAVKAFAKGGPARLVQLEVHELKSIWKKLGSNNSEKRR